MNYNLEDSLVIPFCVEKESLKSAFLEWRKEKQETPLDIMLKAKLLEIRKLYIPVRKFYDVQYQAKWKALSIWEHTEEYTEYETEIVYINKSGTACRSMIDAKDRSDPYFTPQAVSRTVPVTKTRKVIDRTDWTAGKVSGSTMPAYIDYSKERSDKFRKWIESVIQAYTKEEYKQYEEAEAYQVLELYGDDEDAFSSIKEQLFFDAEEKGKEQVPGSRFKEFSIKSFETDYNVNVVLLPVFQVSYSYCDKEYCYYVSGLDADVIYTENHPIDDEFVGIKNKLTNELENKKTKKSRYWQVVIVAGIIGAISGLSIYFLDLGWIVFRISMIGILIFLPIYVVTRRKVKLLEKEFEELHFNRINARTNVEQGKNIEFSSERESGEEMGQNCNVLTKESTNSDIIYGESTQEKFNAEEVEQEQAQEAVRDNKTERKGKDKKKWRIWRTIVLCAIVISTLGYFVIYPQITQYIQNQENQEKADRVMNLIQSVTSDEIVIDSEKDLDSAKLEYNSLSDEQKALVENYGKLEEAYTELNKLKEEQVNQEKAESVIDAIEAVEPDSLTDIDTSIQKIRAKYEGLTEEQKKLVTNVDKLEEYEVIVQQKKELKLAEEAQVKAENEKRNEIEELFSSPRDYIGLWGDFGGHVDKYQGMIEAAIKSSGSLSNYFGGDINNVYMELRTVGDYGYAVVFKGPSASVTEDPWVLEGMVTTNADRTGLQFIRGSYYASDY